MSIKLMSKVWDSHLNLSSSQKFVLLCLADFANDDGASCYPSYGKIAKKCALSKRSVMRIVQELQQMELIHIHHAKRNDGGQSANRYFINTNLLHKRSYKDCDSMSWGWSNDDNGVVTECHPIYPPYEPPVNIKKNIIKKKKDEDQNLQENITKNKDKTKELVNDAKEVIRLIKKLTGRNYQETTKSYITLIIARMNEGATLQDCKMVVARMATEWLGDEKMDQYVRPTTLFNKTNFPEYLAKCVPDEEIKKRRKENV